MRYVFFEPGVVRWIAAQGGFVQVQFGLNDIQSLLNMISFKLASIKLLGTLIVLWGLHLHGMRGLSLKDLFIEPGIGSVFFRCRQPMLQVQEVIAHLEHIHQAGRIMV